MSIYRFQALASWPRIRLPSLPIMHQLQLNSARRLSQSPKLCAPGHNQHSESRRVYTPQQLSSFVNYYKVLGLQSYCPETSIKLAFNALTKRFHPDVLRHADIPEHMANDPQRVEFVQLNTAYQVLRDPVKKKLYDAMLMEISAQIEASSSQEFVDLRQRRKDIAAETRSRIGGTPKSTSTRDRCEVEVASLPAQCRPLDIVHSVKGLGRTGRILRLKMGPPKHTSVTSIAFITFDSDRAAQLFALAAFNGEFQVLGTRVFRTKLWPSSGPTAKFLGLVKPEHSRILIVEGPKLSPMMNADALREGFAELKGHDGADLEVREHMKDADTRVIEFEFTNYLGTGFTSMGAKKWIERNHKDLKVSYGIDPCAA